MKLIDDLEFDAEKMCDSRLAPKIVLHRSKAKTHAVLVCLQGTVQQAGRPEGLDLQQNEFSLRVKQTCSGLRCIPNIH